MNVTIYHNPRCSKSRAALALLEEREVALNVVNYLETPLSRGEFERLIALVGGDPTDLVRTGDAAFKEAGLALAPDAMVSDVARLLHSHPALMQRPLVVAGTRALVARPPERVLELL